jgi:hypothetical protein
MPRERRAVEKHREGTLDPAAAFFDGIGDAVVFRGYLLLARDGFQSCHELLQWWLIQKDETADERRSKLNRQDAKDAKKTDSILKRRGAASSRLISLQDFLAVSAYPSRGY